MFIRGPCGSILTGLDRFCARDTQGLAPCTHGAEAKRSPEKPGRHGCRGAQRVVLRKYTVLCSKPDKTIRQQVKQRIVLSDVYDRGTQGDR